MIDDREAVVVRRIFEEFASGISPLAIVARLNAEGVRTPRGRRWRVSALVGSRKRQTGILNNPTYIGRPEFGKQHYIKDPATGRRQARPNPRKDWLERDAPDFASSRTSYGRPLRSDGGESTA